MPKIILITCMILLFGKFLIAQSNSGGSTPASDSSALQSIASHNLKKTDNRGKFYFYWGYNGSAFTHSDIHFAGPDYDFTFFDVKAHDRPSHFSAGLYLNPATISIPQYNYRLGYHFTDRWSISLGQDHMKYVVDQNQTVLMSGFIDDAVSTAYHGVYVDSAIILSEDFLKFEHTDGLNLVSLDLEYTLPLLSLPDGKMNVSFSTGIGLACMIPRTDVRVFGEGINNKFHLAGYSISAKAGPRIEFFHNFFLLAQVRTGYINLPDILLNNSSPQRADQHFSFLEYFVAAGFTFPFHKNH
ncbi:MAG: hypothetical protein ABIO46_00785 [Chitinophagales bacterium]